MKKILSLTLFFFCILSGQAQNIAINESGNQPDTSAMLDISSTTRGFLIPRMTKAQRNAIALPANGLMVYQTGPDSTGFHYYNGTQWLWFVTADIKNAWALEGNSNTDSMVNFLGTTDNKPLMLRLNNLPAGQLNSKTHNFFIGGGSGADNTATQNVGYGDSTLNRNTTAIGNTAIGHKAMKGSGAITGSFNTAIGNGALADVTSGLRNVAVGENAMAHMQSGIYNIAVGVGASEMAVKGDANIALGLQALRMNDSSSHNIAIGYQALYNNDSARNIAIGYQSLYYNNRRSNLAIGHQAGVYNNYLQTNPALGVENTYMGFQSGYYANTGSQNVAMGSRALMGSGYFNGDDPANTAYKRNVAIGDSAMFDSYGSDNVGIGYRALSKSNNSNAHVAVGSRALLNTTATYPNTAVGYSSQDSCTTGVANTSLGSYALTKNTTGFNNTAIGNSAMHDAFNAINPAWMYDNTAVGNDALRRVRYSGETAVGAGALRNDTSGLYNTAVGYLTMYNHLTGSYNTALGTNTLRNDSNGISNTAIGMNALYLHKTGDHNTAVGTNALFSDSISYANVAMGSHALFSHKKNNYNTALGYEAMYYDNSGFGNSALGYRSLRYAKNGTENTALGVGAIEFTDSSMYNVAVGRGAMMGKGGWNNTAIGVYASGLHPGAPTTNYYVNETTCIGAYAGYKNIANMNTFVGISAGYGASADSLRGIENTGVGAYTLYYNTSGKSNTSLGIGSLFSNTTGSGNTAVGTRALGYSNGSYNVAVGDSALFNNSANSNVALGTNAMRFNNTGGDNAATGNNSLINNSTGAKNTAMGGNALSSNQTGSFNTAVGYNANTSAAGLANATAIGANAYVSQNNSIILGSINGVNSATADTKVGVGTTAPDSTFSVANKFTVGSSGTVQYDNSVAVMNYMFKSGSSNTNRMIVAHSPGFANYGLQYQDAGDKFHFLSGGIQTMTIDLGFGRVGIGVASPNYQLQLSTDAAAKLSTSTWSTTSDIRLKTVDGNYTKGLKEILQLNTIMYHYAKGNVRNLATDVQAYGFSAQEVQKVFPEAVTEEKDGYLSLNIHPILIAYVNAIKEQQHQIDTLTKELEQKRNSKDDVIEKLLQRIEVLEAKTATIK